MESVVTKLKSSITAAPLGAVVGAFIGYRLAKQLGYDKNLTVVSFGVVGLIIGAELTKTLK